mgnify:CR=1 FL=1
MVTWLPNQLVITGQKVSGGEITGAAITGILDFLMFGGAEAAFLINYKGLSVHLMQTLRKHIREANGTLKVTKARLMKIAAQNIQARKDLADIASSNRQPQSPFEYKEINGQPFSFNRFTNQLAPVQAPENSGFPVKKLTPEELQDVINIREEYTNIVAALGEIEIEKYQLLEKIGRASCRERV